MQGGPLADDLAPQARILELVRRGTGKMIGGDVADAVAAGLDGVHLDFGQIGQKIRHFGKLDPIVLNVLARRDVAIAFVVAPRDMREAAHLA